MSFRRNFLVAFSSFLVIGGLVAWIYANPPASEQFASLAVLGNNPPFNTPAAGAYFPNNNLIVNATGETVSWTIQVYNHMGSADLFLVYVYLANRTISGPDPGIAHAPTNRTLESRSLLEKYHIVMNNETWSFPLQWSINNRTLTGNVATIHSMVINGQTVSGIDIPGSIPDPTSNNFRLVIELWSYDVTSHAFLFTYATNLQYSVFNQIWFTVH